jgi:hypothetical protein
MGFFSDLGKGIASVVKAPFEAVGSLAAGVGAGIGNIIHGSNNMPQGAPQFAGQMAAQCQGQNPMMATQLLNLQNALMTNMLLSRALYSPCLCGMGAMG